MRARLGAGVQDWVLGPGELIAVPHPLEHRTVADEEVHLLLIERSGDTSALYSMKTGQEDLTNWSVLSGPDHSARSGHSKKRPARIPNVLTYETSRKLRNTAS